MVWGGLVLKPGNDAVRLYQGKEFLVTVAISNNEILAASHVRIKESHRYQISLAIWGQETVVDHVGSELEEIVDWCHLCTFQYLPLLSVNKLFIRQSIYQPSSPLVYHG